MDPAKSQELISRLREEIRRREAAPPSGGAGCLASGFAPLDALLPGGGFPSGRVVELTGARACGKLTLALMALAAATRRGELAALVDPRREFYPPAARALGAELSRLLVVRPPDPAAAFRAACLLARSRAFSALVLDAAAPGGAPVGPSSRRLLEAAETGRAVLLVLSDQPSGLDASLRLRIERPDERELCLTLERSRLGAPGRSARGRLPLPEDLPAPALRALGQLVEGPPINQER